MGSGEMEVSANLLRSRDGNNTTQPLGKGCKTSLADSIPAPSRHASPKRCPGWPAKSNRIKQSDCSSYQPMSDGIRFSIIYSV